MTELTLDNEYQHKPLAEADAVEIATADKLANRIRRSWKRQQEIDANMIAMLQHMRKTTLESYGYTSERDRNHYTISQNFCANDDPDPSIKGTKAIGCDYH